MKKYKLHIIVPFVVCVLLLLAGGAWFMLGSDGMEYKEYAASRLEVSRTLCERGILESLNSSPVELETSGEILEIVKSGTRVKKGQVVVVIDESDRADTLSELRLGIDSTKMDKEVNLVNLELVEQKARNQLTLTAKKLEMAELEYKRAKAGLTASERRLLEISVELAKLDLEDAQDEYARQKNLKDKGFISESMFEPYARKVEVEKASLEEAQTELHLKEKGVVAEELLEYQRAVARLKALLRRSEKAMQRKMEQVQNNIEINEANIRQDTFHANRIQKEIEGAAVHAKIDGIMHVHLYRDWRSGGRWIEYKPGIKKYERDRLATIIDPSVMKVSIMVNESDINRVKEGLDVHVRLPAYPGKSFPGKVINVGGVGRDRFDVAPRGYESGTTGVTMFNVGVSFDGNGVEFRPGMSALVEIVVEEPSTRLVLPRQLVAVEDGKFYVNQKGIMGVSKVRIEGEYFNEKYFSVTDGLAEGDTVVLVREKIK